MIERIHRVCCVGGTPDPLLWTTQHPHHSWTQKHPPPPTQHTLWILNHKAPIGLTAATDAASSLLLLAAAARRASHERLCSRGCVSHKLQGKDVRSLRHLRLETVNRSSSYSPRRKNLCCDRQTEREWPHSTSYGVLIYESSLGRSPRCLLPE